MVDVMVDLDPSIVEALSILHRELAASCIPWVLTGSASFALQGVPVIPEDVDLQTSSRGAYRIEERFADVVVDPVVYSSSETIRSHFGTLEVAGVPVEVMGGLQKRVDGGWERPVDVTAHREFVTVFGMDLPVLSLSYEATAYETLGRTERAALLRSFVE